MKTLIVGLLLVAGVLSTKAVLAQKTGSLNKSIQAPGKSVSTGKYSALRSKKTSQSSGTTVFATGMLMSSGQMTQIANGILINEIDINKLGANLAPANNDPLGNYLKDDQPTTPVTYGLTYKSWVVFDEWMLRMATCMDQCEAFWDAYPACRTATTKKQMVAALGYGENQAQAFADVLKANPDFSGIFLFYDDFVKYYNTMDYHPMRSYAGNASFRINWLALDPYDFYIAILQNNLSMIDAKEGSGQNRGNVRTSTTFIPAKK